MHIISKKVLKHHHVNFTITQQDFTYRQFLIYCSVLSQVSPLYYSVASNAGTGQSPYPYGCARPKALPKFVTLIIAQIGRENNISAEIYVSRTVEDAGHRRTVEDAGPYKL